MQGQQYNGYIHIIYMSKIIWKKSVFMVRTRSLSFIGLIGSKHIWVYCSGVHTFLAMQCITTYFSSLCMGISLTLNPDRIIVS